MCFDGNSVPYKIIGLDKVISVALIGQNTFVKKLHRPQELI